MKKTGFVYTLYLVEDALRGKQWAIADCDGHHNQRAGQEADLEKLAHTCKNSVNSLFALGLNLTIATSAA